MNRNMNKRGFTLIEMIATIAIIVIMSSAVAISATSYMNRAQSVASNVDAKTANYESAMSQVDSLTELGTSVETPTPLPTVGTITIAPTSAPTTAPTTAPTATPTAKPTATPTAKPTATTAPTAAPTATTAPTAAPTSAPTLPTALANTSTSVQDISSWGQAYDYRVSLQFPSASYKQYLKIYVPTGATVGYDWGATIVSQSGNYVVVKVDAYSTSSSIFVDYTGGTPAVIITSASKKAP